MDLSEIFGKVKNGTMAFHSELGTRDESRQTKNYTPRILKLKTTAGIDARVLVPKDLVIPFNPFTGKVDEVYNKKAPFRPIMLVHSSLSLICQACAEDEDLHKFWEKTLSLEFDPKNPPEMFHQAFMKAGFVKPRVHTFDVVAVNVGGEEGLPEFKAKYMVDSSQLNDKRTYDYDTAPFHHKAAALFSDILREEFKAAEVALKRSGATKDKIKEVRRDIYKRNPISFVGPANILPFFYFPLDTPIKPPKEDEDPTDFILSSMRLYTFSDKWVGALTGLMKKISMFDEHPDFYDFHMVTPGSDTINKNTGAVYKDDDSNDLYQALSISSIDARMSVVSGKTELTDANGKTVSYDNADYFAPITKAARDYFIKSQAASAEEGGLTFEAIITASCNFRPITSVQDALPAATNTIFNRDFASSEFCTEVIEKRHSETLLAMCPANAALFMADDQEDLDAAVAEKVKDLDSVINEVNDALTESDFSMEDLEVALDAALASTDTTDGVTIDLAVE